MQSVLDRSAILSKYSVQHGSSGSRSERFAIYDLHGDCIGAAYTINGGNTWQIKGLFPEPMRRFTDSQTAIEVAVAAFEASQRKLSARSSCPRCGEVPDSFDRCGCDY